MHTQAHTYTNRVIKHTRTPRKKERVGGEGERERERDIITQLLSTSM